MAAPTTAEMLEAIEIAIAAGVTTIDVDGVRTTYASLDKLIEARDVLKREQSRDDQSRPVNANVYLGGFQG